MSNFPFQLDPDAAREVVCRMLAMPEEDRAAIVRRNISDWLDDIDADAPFADWQRACLVEWGYLVPDALPIDFDGKTE